MKHAIFSIRDSKADRFLQPFFSDTALSAQRAVKQEMMRDPKSPFFLFADDYTLFLVGYYDDVSGVVESFGPENICGLFSVKTEILKEQS